MKAKEHAERFIKSGKTITALAEVLTGFLMEMADLTKQRHVGTVEGGLAVLREQEDKWKVFVRLVDPRNKKLEGEFLLAVGTTFPGILMLKKHQKMAALRTKWAERMW